MSAYERECEHGYDYEPLSSTGGDSDAFRLLLLEPSTSRGDELRGSLRNTTLAECDYDLIDPYTALSYVWGTSERACRIRLIHDGGHGNLFAITKSLGDALRDLRDPTRVRRVWADALCIDQQNVGERNAQVSLMGRIYSTAHSTVIHLGNLTPDVSDVFSVPRGLAAEPETDNGESTDVAVTRAGGGPWSLLSKTWFERVWVFQELVLSRDPWVQCGCRRIRWREFCNYFLGRSPGASQRAHGDEEKQRVMADMNSSWASKSRFPLHRAVKARRGLGATNPADFVYATFGIISDLNTVEQYLKVDYNMPVGHTFGKVAQYMFYQLGIEQMMFHVDDAPATKRIEGLPSWAPDWTLEASYTKRNPLCMVKDNSLTHIRVKGVHHAFTQPANSGLPHVLGHIGMRVATIQHVSCVVPFGPQNSHLTAEYDCARADLMKLYRNAYGSGDRFGQYRHVPLKGKEAEHEHLCEVVGGTWVRAFENFHRQSTPNCSSGATIPSARQQHGETRFVEILSQWLASEASKKREFVGSGTSGVIKRLYGYFARTTGDSDLEGRRLASTVGGGMSIVPAQASQGDVIAYLVGSDTPVLLRSWDAGAHEREIECLLLESLRRRGFGVVTMTNEQKEQELWRVPEEGDVSIEHFSVIGEAYLDGHVGWALRYLPKESDMRVFALH
ncbi:HET domain-containing protein [Colletotrichum orchidophilum]|uniref:HET domain-containing protein n=1 Tax=Colletotrichum orchidophilum TaxID=1209926 RepID=A0A1G4ASF7_9PEZI|nr:HET domain-containing protein [Colletotrichum orchidophilum]OHE92104.1 HET domain-containing protein [Colletotrichum orchidophilum]